MQLASSSLIAINEGFLSSFRRSSTISTGKRQGLRPTQFLPAVVNRGRSKLAFAAIAFSRARLRNLAPHSKFHIEGDLL